MPITQLVRMANPIADYAHAHLTAIFTRTAPAGSGR